MSDNVTANSGSGGATFAADDIGGVHYPRTKISIGADGEAADLDSGQATMANSVPVVIASDQSAVPVTVSGVATAANQSTMITSLQLLDDSIFAEDTAASAADKGIAILAVRRDADTSLVGTDNDYANLQVNANGALKVEVFDGGDSHTVDDGGSTLSIDDGGGSITVDGSVSVSGAVDTELTTADLDTGAGTDTRAVVGLVLAASGGGVLVGAANPMPVSDNGGALSVDDGGSSLTVDGTVAATQSGNWTARIADGSGNALTSKAPGSERALSVAIVDGSGNQVTSFGGSGGTSATDDSAFTAASGSGTPMMGFVTSDSVDAGDVGVVGMLANRQLKVTLYDSGGAELSVGGGTQYDEDAAHSTGSKVTGCGIVRKDTAASLAGTDGDYTLPIADANGKMWVNAEVTVALPAGTNTIGKLAANSGVDIGDVDVTTVTPGTGASNLGKAEDAAHSSGDVGVMALAVRKDSAAASSGTDGDYEPLSTDSSGQLRVTVGNTVTVGSHAVTNAGTFAVQVDGSALTALQKIDDPVIVDDAAFTPATSSVMMVGFQADETSTDSIDEGDAGAARMTLDRKLIVTPQPHAAGGLSIFRSIDLDETEEEVKGSAGCVYEMWVTNTATSTRWLKFYNATAANVTVGTTTPVLTIGIPGNSSDDISGKFGSGMGIYFDTAITVAATTGVADNDTGAPGANEVIVNIFYK